MSERKRTAVVALLVLLALTSMFFSSAMHVGYNCPGEGCEICLQLLHLKDFIDSILTFVGVLSFFCALLSLLGFARLPVSGAFSVYDTPVRLKDKLSN